MDTPPVVTSKSHLSNADFNAAVKLLRSSFATPASVASKPFDLSSVIRVVWLTPKSVIKVVRITPKA